nr:PREDICTED: uncharacterized protein LOC105675267 [Linepithema humile]
MKTNRRGHWCRLLLVAAILFEHANAEKRKRQIFREQVLPALGGKIPEEAFRTDRLALNRLNKEGITVPDGIVLDARHIHKHSYSDKKMLEIIKVYLTSDGRYVSPEGRPHYNHPKTVDTTYIIRRPFMHTNHKTLNAYEKLTNYPKPQVYSNYRQFVPIVSSIKPEVYKPIMMPLILPADTELFDSSWRTEYDWDTVYKPFDDYFIDNIALFNSHRVITDYQGFLDEFHERSLRHVDFESSDRNQQHRQDQKYQELQSGLKLSSYQKIKSIIANPHNPAYTNLTSIPETSFSCRGRNGMFADIETKCQVFHNCLGSSKVSSLCPPGTAFYEANKRCEWFDIVQCKQERVPVDDYHDEYQNFQPIVGFRQPIIVKEESKKEQDFSKIPGIPGIDYPIYHTVPPTSFSCAYVPFVPGMYANVETGCQAYHICHDGREGHQGASFLCTNGTLFNQHEFACDWWYNVNCANAPSLYRLNGDPLKNPYVPKETKDAIRKKMKIIVI